MVQWLRVCLPIQEQFHPWSRKIPQTTKSMHHNYWGHALEPTNHDPWSPLAYSTCSAKTEAPAARSPCTATREQALPSTTRESPHSGQDPAQPKINKVLLQKKKKKKKKRALLCSVLCGSLDGKGVWGRKDICTCVAESLRCSLETITTLFVNQLHPTTK